MGVLFLNESENKRKASRWRVSWKDKINVKRRKDGKTHEQWQIFYGRWVDAKKRKQRLGPSFAAFLREPKIASARDGDRHRRLFDGANLGNQMEMWEGKIFPSLIIIITVSSPFNSGQMGIRSDIFFNSSIQLLLSSPPFHTDLISSQLLPNY